MAKQVIITADDFGWTLPVNEAVEQAHREGVLAATSLLIGAPHAADAIARARRNPTLRVGLHLAVCEGNPVLSREYLPALVNARGELYGPIRAALSLFFVPGASRQLEQEMRAQFLAFAETGLTFDHVNGHNNMQMHPVVLPILIRVAREFGVRAVRVSFEPLLASARAAAARSMRPPRRPRARLWLRFLQWSVLWPWAAYVRWRYRRAGFIVNDYLFGMYDCGGMDTALLLGVIRNLPEGISEIHCHPATQRSASLQGPMPDYEQQAELAALISHEVRDVLDACGAQRLSGYGELSTVPQGTLDEAAVSGRAPMGE